MANSYRLHFFHLIWSTKQRQGYILPKIQQELYPYMRGIIQKYGANLLEIGGIDNHVHLLIQQTNLDQYVNTIRNVKTGSSGWLKKEFVECKDFAWQDGYGSFSVSYSQVEQVREYIKHQEEHHQKISFEEEYIRFLKLNNIEFDEKYVFD